MQPPAPDSARATGSTGCEVNVSEFVGKTFASIQGLNVGSERVLFATDAESYAMFHSQNCCESVKVEDVCGEPSDLIGVPILDASERSSSSASEDDPSEGKKDEYDDSWTWTFYRLSTIKGTVVIRWYGTSNGYYSEDVEIEVQ